MFSIEFFQTKSYEWAGKLFNQGLAIKITGYDGEGGSFGHLYYALARYVDGRYFQPVLTLYQPILIPRDIVEEAPGLSEYPIRIEIELFGSVPIFDFDVMFVYDEV